MKKIPIGATPFCYIIVSSSNTLIIEYLYLESEVLLQVLDDHDQERQLDPQRLAVVRRAVDVVRAHVGAHDLQHARLDVLVGDALDVAIAHLLVPDLQRLAADRVQDREEARLERVAEHGLGGGGGGGGALSPLLLSGSQRQDS